MILLLVSLFLATDLVGQNLLGDANLATEKVINSYFAICLSLAFN